MPLKVNLSIPSPCQEPWDSMLPKAEGRFCQDCSKTVIDFTSLTEEQIIQVMLQQKGKVCGRFKENQLKHYANPLMPAIPQAPVSKLLLAAGLTCASASASFSQAQPVEPKLYLAEGAIPVQKPDTSVLPPHKPSQGFQIKGQVLIENGAQPEPVASVAVLVKGTSIGTATDKDGNYTITLDEAPSRPLTLVFRFIGYKTTEKLVPLNDTAIADMGTTLLPLDIGELTGEVVVVHSNAAGRMWWNLKSLFYRIF